MIGKLSLLALGGLALAVLLPMGAAQADAIDGDWCHAEAGRMEISGPHIVTPGGTQMQGIYGRHSFSYIVPTIESNAGATLNMILIDDDTVHLTNGSSTVSPTPQIWRRCPASVS
jgi:hypothetical protein